MTVYPFCAKPAQMHGESVKGRSVQITSERTSARDQGTNATRTTPAQRLSLLSMQQFDPRQLDSSSGIVGDRTHHVLIGRGPFRGQADQIEFDTCALRLGFLSQTVKVQVKLATERVTLGLALSADQTIQIHGKLFCAGNVTAFGSGEEIDAVFNAGVRWVTFNMPLEAYAAEIAATAEHAALREPRNTPRLAAGNEALKRLSGLLDEVERLAHTRPELFDDVQWRTNLERDLKSQFFGLLDDAVLQERSRSEFHLMSSHRILCEVEASLEGEDSPMPAIATICRKIGVPRRSLERAFRDVLGMSPAAYLRVRALNIVRHRLVAAPAEPGMVSRIAVDQGFWHLGRFAAAYRALFDERPADTLRRRFA